MWKGELSVMYMYSGRKEGGEKEEMMREGGREGEKRGEMMGGGRERMSEGMREESK